MDTKISMIAYKTLNFNMGAFEVVFGGKLVVIRRDKQEITMSREEFSNFVQLIEQISAESKTQHTI